MKILIADRDWIVRDSISRLASEIVPTATIFTAQNGEDLDLIVVANPDLAIAIIDDAIIDGGEEALFARLRSRAPGAAIGVLALAIDRERVLKAVYFGAVAIILKSEGRDQIARSLSLLISGKSPSLVTFWNAAPRGPKPRRPPSENGASRKIV